MKDRFMKNGIFSLEYDKETLKDMVLELQEENQKYKEVIDKVIEHINKYENIKAYYDEYNYDEDFKKELLDILKEVSE